MHEKREEPKESPWTDDEPVRSGDRGLRQRWRARDSGKTAGWRASGHWTQGCSAVAAPAQGRSGVRLRPGNLVVDSFLFALPSRLEAAASHGDAACPGDATLHHRLAGTGSDRPSLGRAARWVAARLL